MSTKISKIDKKEVLKNHINNLKKKADKISDEKIKELFLEILTLIK